MERIRPRWFRRNLQTGLRVLPVSVLAGARQTGKTTLTRAIEPTWAYFTLDDVGVLDQAERNPDSLLATRPVILDEVQRAPQILLAVNRAEAFLFNPASNSFTSGLAPLLSACRTNRD